MFRSCDLWVMGPPRYHCAILLTSLLLQRTIFLIRKSTALKTIYEPSDSRQSPRVRFPSPQMNTIPSVSAMD